MPTSSNLSLFFNAFFVTIIVLLSFAAAYYRLHSNGKPRGSTEKLSVYLVGPILGLALYVLIANIASPWLKRTLRHQPPAEEHRAPDPSSKSHSVASILKNSL
jgi:4-amino-4-deoxy-L-arabinose transferase-like glycosyltransferase